MCSYHHLQGNLLNDSSPFSEEAQVRIINTQISARSVRLRSLQALLSFSFLCSWFLSVLVAAELWGWTEEAFLHKRSQIQDLGVGCVWTWRGKAESDLFITPSTTAQCTLVSWHGTHQQGETFIIPLLKGGYGKECNFFVTLQWFPHLTY